MGANVVTHLGKFGDTFDDTYVDSNRFVFECVGWYFFKFSTAFGATFGDTFGDTVSDACGDI